LISSAGWVNPRHGQDGNGTGVVDGYEQAGHLYIQDNSNSGVHQ